MSNRTITARTVSNTNPPLTSIAANVILGIAMFAAVLIGASDFSARSLATELVSTQDVQGRLTHN